MQFFLSTSGIILSVILLYFNSRNNKSSIYLGVFFLLAGLYGLTFYVLFNSESVELLAVIFANSGFIAVLVGPSLYFYIRSVLNGDPSLKKYDLLHMLPFLAFLIFASPYLLSSWSFKTKAAEAFMQDFQSQDTFNTAFLGNKFLTYVVFVLPAFQVLVYVIWSLLLFIRFLKQDKKKEVFFRLQSTMKWIKAFLGIEILLVSGHLLFMVKIFVIGDIRGFNSLNSLQFILGLGPMAILILTFFSPGILYGLPRVPEHRAEVQIPEKPAENGKTAGKTSHIKLESGYLQSIGNEADAFMEKFQPYTNPHFNLSELSVMLHIPDHHFTYYFREVKKQTFSDYRNQWRVEHAKKLIREGKSNDLTLEAIGILSGFSSRNTFLNAFKKAEGISPQAFLLQVKKK